jgi:multicomponent Na+:H+ antiporter subunit D
VLSLWHLLSLPEGHQVGLQLFDYALQPVRVDRLSLVWGYVFHIAAILSAIYAAHEKSALGAAAGAAYAGSAIGAAFAGDLLTLFVFWELTAITSVFLIWQRGTPRAAIVGVRYLVIQVASGVILLAGTLLHLADTGSLAFEKLSIETTSGALILIAFGIKAAFPLLHNWLQDSYPEATVTGSVVLSAFTTKLAIYALARGYAGTDLLIPIGVVMTLFPIVYAVIENDLRRVLAYSLNNQLGFMVVGVGLGTELGLNGAVAHAFADILFKGLLFMSMGAVLLRAGTVKGSDLGGLYKSMPVTAGLCMVGAASISAFPLFSGFVTKSMIMASAAEEGYIAVWLVLLFASAGVFHHAGIKIPFFAFFAHDSGIRCREAPRHMLVAMLLTAALCVGIGIFPQQFYALLPLPMEYLPYTASHVLSQMQLLVFSALAFSWLMRNGIYPPELHSVNLDFDWTYRRLFYRGALGAAALVSRLVGGAEAAAGRGWRRLESGAMRLHGPRSVLARTWASGAMGLGVMLMLLTFLLSYYLA